MKIALLIWRLFLIVSLVILLISNKITVSLFLSVLLGIVLFSIIPNTLSYFFGNNKQRNKGG